MNLWPLKKRIRAIKHAMFGAKIGERYRVSEDAFEVHHSGKIGVAIFASEVAIRLRFEDGSECSFAPQYVEKVSAFEKYPTQSTVRSWPRFTPAGEVVYGSDWEAA